MFVFAIKIIREEKGISLKELSAKTGISISYLSRLENNAIANPRMSTIYKISNVLEEKIENFCFTIGNIEKLKNELNLSVEKYGLHAPNTQKISQILDLLLVEKMKQDDLSNF